MGPGIRIGSWIRIFSPLTRKSAEPMSFDCERMVFCGFGRLITMEK
jgi:uncharacterized protein YbaA (DUF1428 family)